MPLFPTLAELHIPSVEFRPLEEPVSLQYGIAWLDIHASRALPGFVEVAREIAEPSVSG